MKNRTTSMKKRILSLLLGSSMIMTSLPVPVSATETASDGLCEHHTVHTAECGYVAAVEGNACSHQHDESCVQVTDTGCVHVHGQDGCTYTPAQEAVSCGHVCSTDVCGYMETVAEVPCECVPGEDGTVIHAEGCGYVAPVAGVACGFVHDGCGCVPAVAESGSCNHICSVESGCQTSVLNCTHTEHTADCGYVAAVEGQACTYALNGCEECREESNGQTETESETTETETESKLDCTCETDDPFLHATNCPAYVAPEHPECFCVEKCTEDTVNVWCDICGVQGIEQCQG